MNLNPDCGITEKGKTKRRQKAEKKEKGEEEDLLHSLVEEPTS